MLDINLDGFNADYSKIETGRIRLCLQIFYKNPDTNELDYKYPDLKQPILSNIISTNKQKLSIIINDTFNMTGPSCGGNFAILFVKKLEKDQKPIFAKFFDNNGWSEDIEVQKIHYRVYYFENEIK